MNGENKVLVTDHFRGIYGIYFKLIKKYQKMTTCNRLDMETLEFGADYAQKSPPDSEMDCLFHKEWSYVAIGT